MSEPIHIISLGAGVQSSTMAFMAAHGEITPMPKCAIFADRPACIVHIIPMRSGADYYQEYGDVYFRAVFRGKPVAAMALIKAQNIVLTGSEDSRYGVPYERFGKKAWDLLDRAPGNQ